MDSKFTDAITVAMKLAIAVFAILLAGCAKDQSQDQYRASQAAANLAQYQAVAGSYPSVAHSNIDGAAVGSVKLVLRADTVTQPSSDGLSQETRAVMGGNLTFTGLTNFSIQFSGGSYDPDTHLFKATFQIKNYADPSATSTSMTTVDISGTISNGTFTGNVYLDSLQGYGFALNSAPGVGSSAAVDEHGVRAQQFARMQKRFATASASDISGVNNDGTPAGKIDAVGLKFQDIELVPEQSFFNLISPKQSTNVTLSTSYMGPSGPASLSKTLAATIDYTGTQPVLRGSLSNSAGFTYQLACTGGSKASGDDFWTCNLQTATQTLSFKLQTVATPPVLQR